MTRAPRPLAMLSIRTRCSSRRLLFAALLLPALLRLETNHAQLAPNPSLPDISVGSGSQPDRANEILPDAPASHLIDEADVLDDRRETDVTRTLTATAYENGIQIYVVTYPSLAGKTAPERAVDLRNRWTNAATVGAAIVYIADTQRFGIAVTRAAKNSLEESILPAIIERAATNLTKTKASGPTLREAILDVEYEIRQSKLEEKGQRSVLLPLFIVGACLAALLLAAAAAWVLARLRLQNYFGSVLSFPLQTTPGRLGGTASGGSCASINFQPKS